MSSNYGNQGFSGVKNITAELFKISQYVKYQALVATPTSIGVYSLRNASGTPFVFPEGSAVLKVMFRNGGVSLVGPGATMSAGFSLTSGGAISNPITGLSALSLATINSRISVAPSEITDSTNGLHPVVQVIGAPITSGNVILDFFYI